MTFREDDDQNVIGGVPLTKVELANYIDDVVNWIVREFLQINNQVSAPYRYLEVAKEAKLPLGRIPIPNPNRNEDEELPKPGHASLKNYNSLGAVDWNSTSTAGHANLVAL